MNIINLSREKGKYGVLKEIVPIRFVIHSFNSENVNLKCKISISDLQNLQQYGVFNSK